MEIFTLVGGRLPQTPPLGFVSQLSEIFLRVGPSNSPQERKEKKKRFSYLVFIINYAKITVIVSSLAAFLTT